MHVRTLAWILALALLALLPGSRARANVFGSTAVQQPDPARATTTRVNLDRGALETLLKSLQLTQAEETAFQTVVKNPGGALDELHAISQGKTPHQVIQTLLAIDESKLIHRIRLHLKALPTAVPVTFGTNGAVKLSGLHPEQAAALSAPALTRAELDESLRCLRAYHLEEGQNLWGNLGIVFHPVAAQASHRNRLRLSGFTRYLLARELAVKEKATGEKYLRALDKGLQEESGTSSTAAALRNKLARTTRELIHKAQPRNHVAILDLASAVYVDLRWVRLATAKIPSDGKEAVGTKVKAALEATTASPVPPFEGWETAILDPARLVAQYERLEKIALELQRARASNDTTRIQTLVLEYARIHREMMPWGSAELAARIQSVAMAQERADKALQQTNLSAADRAAYEKQKVVLAREATRLAALLHPTRDGAGKAIPQIEAALKNRLDGRGIPVDVFEQFVLQRDLERMKAIQAGKTPPPPFGVANHPPLPTSRPAGTPEQLGLPGEALVKSLIQGGQVNTNAPGFPPGWVPATSGYPGSNTPGSVNVPPQVNNPPGTYTPGPYTPGTNIPTSPGNTTYVPPTGPFGLPTNNGLGNTLFPNNNTLFPGNTTTTQNPTLTNPTLTNNPGLTTDPSRIDSDGDGVPDGQDPAPNDPNIPNPNGADPNVRDSDGDGVPDAQDPAPNDPTITGNEDPNQVDTDNDGVPDAQDPDPNDPNVTGSGPDDRDKGIPSSDTDDGSGKDRDRGPGAPTGVRPPPLVPVMIAGSNMGMAPAGVDAMAIWEAVVGEQMGKQGRDRNGIFTKIDGATITQSQTPDGGRDKLWVLDATTVGEFQKRLQAASQSAVAADGADTGPSSTAATRE